MTWVRGKRLSPMQRHRRRYKKALDLLEALGVEGQKAATDIDNYVYALICETHRLRIQVKDVEAAVAA